MTLIKSISGIRGTLENIPGESLSDYDINQFTLAYHQEIISRYDNQVVVLGRDARKSGIRISEIVSEILINEGCDVIDVGLVTTPTLGICTKKMKASGGIMISASHNDEKWNALKTMTSNLSITILIASIILAINGNYFFLIPGILISLLLTR